MVDSQGATVHDPQRWQMPVPMEWNTLMSGNEGVDDPAEVMRREMSVVMGTVPTTIDSAFFDDDGFVISASEFLFETFDAVRFHYRKGRGIVVQMPGDGVGAAKAPEDTDFELFLWGTVFGAVAWLNGLFPLHASAADFGGRIVAFTADSGGGKSTLAAGLAQLGLPHVCDDTLVVSIADRIMAMPDAKPLKLWDDALVLTSNVAARPVQSMPGKHYAHAGLKASGTLPLTDLCFIEFGESVELVPVLGVEKLQLLPGALYRNFVHAARGDRATHEKLLLRFCAEVRFWKLRRPRNPHSFSSDLQCIKDILSVS